MQNRTILVVGAAGVAAALTLAAQTRRPGPVFRAGVDVVMLSVTVRDGDKYVPGLRAEDFEVLEDDGAQTVDSFAELASTASRRIPAAENNTFVLFDTSNCMYQGFPYAEDSISRFVRSLDGNGSVAIYTFSRNLIRAAPLTPDRESAIGLMRQTVAGDDTAMYNAILLTLRDAARVPGRKTIVVFSNGPDNASMVRPSDVARIAQDEGIPIYVLSTREGNRVTRDAVEMLTGETGGRAYLAPSRRGQEAAFSEIQTDLRNMYLLAYTPAPNPNRGFRRIQVRIRGHEKYTVRTRSGYTPRPVETRAGLASAAADE